MTVSLDQDGRIITWPVGRPAAPDPGLQNREAGGGTPAACSHRSFTKGVCDRCGAGLQVETVERWQETWRAMKRRIVAAAHRELRTPFPAEALEAD